MALNYQNFAPTAPISPLQAALPVIGGIANIGGSALASGAQTGAAGSAINTQNQFYGQATANSSPYMQAGGAALNALGSLYGLPGYAQMDPAKLSNMLTSLPGYQFQLQQGSKAIDQNAAARGMLASGATGQALEQYGQGLAGSYLNNYIGGLGNLAQLGYGSTNALNALGSGYADRIGSAQIYQGNAKAGGFTSAAGGLGQALYGLPNLLNSFGGGGAPGGGTSTAFGGSNPNLYQAPAGGYGPLDPSAGGTIDPTTGIGTDFNPQIDPSLASGFNPDTFDPYSFNAAGGEAANQIASGAQSMNNAEFAAYHAAAGDGSTALQPTGGASPAPVVGSNLFNGLGSSAATAGEIFGIQQGLAHGGLTGNAQAALSAGALANRGGAFGGNPAFGYGLGAAGGALGLYNGLQRGGVLGYGNAAVGGLRAASGLEGVFGNTGLAGTLGSAAGMVAAPLAVYSALKNWRSGATGSDALNGAAAGAALGSVIPGLGTLVGGLAGGAIGAASSAFGPGKMDPENTNWNSYAAAFDKNPTAVAGASPSQNFQALAGIFDSRGTSIPFYNQYGRMGENQFTTAMTSQINDAIKSGQIAKNASPQQIYNQVVEPWITKMGGKSGWQNTYTSKGASEKNAVGGLLTNLIGQWQSGALNSRTPVGVNGQTITGLPSLRIPRDREQSFHGMVNTDSTGT